MLGCRCARKRRCARPGPGRLLPPRREALHAPVGRLGHDIIRWTPPRFREKQFHYSPCVAAPRAGEPILESSTRSPRDAHNVKHARPAQSLHVEGAHHWKRGIKPFLFSPFKAILTTRVTVKFGSQGIGEDRRDLPACCCNTARQDRWLHRKSHRAKPGRHALEASCGLHSPARRPRIEYPRSLHVCFDFSLKHRKIPVHFLQSYRVHEHQRIERRQINNRSQ